MWPFHKILFLSDSCPQCKGALGQALQLAEKSGSQLMLFDFACSPERGDQTGRILEAARAGNADLIFLPRHSSGGSNPALDSVFLGVLGRTKCPVWIAPESGPPRAKDAGRGPVVCALEPSPGSEAHLASAAGLAQAYGTKLHLIHAVPEMPEARQRLAAFERAMGWLMEFRRKLARSAEIAVHAGEVVKVVMRAVQTRGASVLVIGHGECGGAPGRLGPHAYRIARDASCPVLVGAPAAAVGLTTEQRRAA